MILEETLEKIKKPSQEAMERCRQRLGFDRKAAAQSWQTGGCSGADCRDDRK